MKIAESTVAMQGSTSRTQAVRSVKTAILNQKLGSFSSSMELLGRDEKDSMLFISDDARNLSRNSENLTQIGSARRITDINDLDDAPKITFLRRIIEMLMKRQGSNYKSHTVATDDRIKALKQDLEQIRNLKGLEVNPLQNEIIPIRGLVVQSENRTTTEFYDSQSLSFEMTATVKTADGREIDVGISLNMSEEFYYKTESIWTETRMLDPLVINFNGNSSLLSGKKFEFDLDCDGEPDQISQLLSGNGFLALDKNGDGTINDGSELFGATSGDGFKDLAAYDEDGNGWIDENDKIFDNLRVWYKDETGMDRLVSLGESGVGAIFLGNVNTTYLLRDDVNSENGMMRSTGFYLNENGTAGTIHHVDMIVG